MWLVSLERLPWQGSWSAAAWVCSHIARALYFDVWRQAVACRDCRLHVCVHVLSLSPARHGEQKAMLLLWCVVAEENEQDAEKYGSY